MNTETAALKQENRDKESLIDINESMESESIPVVEGVNTEDVVQVMRLSHISNVLSCSEAFRSHPITARPRHNQGVNIETDDNDTTAAASKLEYLVNKWRTDIAQGSVFESVSGQYCIYKVPIMIRRVNEELYTPELISIGPLHYNKPKLVDMEKKKKQYMKSFSQQTTEDKIYKIISFIIDNEKQIRACYAEISSLESLEFVMMILYDSIFIIEILRKNSKDRWDILLDTVPIRNSLWNDLQLFENQLPYFILEEIYELAFGGSDEPTFMELSTEFFGDFMGVNLTPELGVKHFTDWRRNSLLKKDQTSESDKEVARDLPCAVKLHESGLKFKFIDIKTGQSVLDIRFKKSKHLIPFFEVNELQIPQLEIYDETECLLRNIMALEQCLYPDDAQVCSYIALMDDLINTAEDVDLLVENKIISNYMGDNASVATMFNKLNQNVVLPPSSYHEICEQLKEHYKNPLNRARATLKRVYFNNPWTGTATVAAIILLVLTITQTVFSILQVV